MLDAPPPLPLDKSASDDVHLLGFSSGVCPVRPLAPPHTLFTPSEIAFCNLFRACARTSSLRQPAAGPIIMDKSTTSGLRASPERRVNYRVMHGSGSRADDIYQRSNKLNSNQLRLIMKMELMALSSGLHISHTVAPSAAVTPCCAPSIGHPSWR